MRLLALALITMLSLGPALSHGEAAPAQRPIAVTMSVGPAAGPSPAFSVRTNLPDETAFTVAVETPTGRVLQQQIASVKDGHFTTPRFGPFAPGGYVLHVLSVVPVMQPPSVQEVIGEFGEHLSGQLVAPSKALPGQGNVVDAHFPITIG